MDKQENPAANVLFTIVKNLDLSGTINLPWWCMFVLYVQTCKNFLFTCPTPGLSYTWIQCMVHLEIAQSMALLAQSVCQYRGSSPGRYNTPGSVSRHIHLTLLPGYRCSVDLKIYVTSKPVLGLTLFPHTHLSIPPYSNV